MIVFKLVEIFEKIKTGIVFALRMGKTKKIIRSTPIEIMDDKQITLDFCFGFHYLHSIKVQYFE